LLTVGCVSFLNARPLIDGLEEESGVRLLSDVPSRLLEVLLSRQASVALCPTIDYQSAPERLCVVPVGAIGSEATTMTVRVFSRQPFAGIDRMAVDADSRTSVALLQVVLHELYRIRPSLTSFNHHTAPTQFGAETDALLLIGDKVVASSPDPDQFPHQLDLGEAWHQITGLPFVFATWMTPLGTDLGELPRLLRRRRDLNRGRIREIVLSCAAEHGWTADLAELYLGSLLRYELGQRELKGMTVFWERCHELGLIEKVRPLVLYDGKGTVYSS
jgi:chorismate dehydratase